MTYPILCDFQPPAPEVLFSDDAVVQWDTDACRWTCSLCDGKTRNQSCQHTERLSRHLPTEVATKLCQQVRKTARDPQSAADRAEKSLNQINHNPEKE